MVANLALLIFKFSYGGLFPGGKYKNHKNP